MPCENQIGNAVPDKSNIRHLNRTARPFAPTSGCWCSPWRFAASSIRLTLWASAETVFGHHAQGSLLDAKGRPVTDEKDEKNAVGSRLIAQPFTDAQDNLPAAAFAAGTSTASTMRRPPVARTWPPAIRNSARMSSNALSPS